MESSKGLSILETRDDVLFPDSHIKQCSIGTSSSVTLPEYVGSPETGCSNEEVKLTCTEYVAISPLSVKTQRVLSHLLEDDKHLLTSLANISALVPDNSAASRRGLRTALELRSVQLNVQFVQSARQVRDGVAAVAQHVNTALEACSRVVDQIGTARARGSRLLTETRHLRHESAKLHGRKRLLLAFSDRFQLTEQQLAALRQQQPAAPFLSSLQRTRRIHDEAQRLLSKARRPDTALELMEQMSLYQESAYDRLFKWVKSRVRCLELEVDSNLLRAMQCLHERPVLFQHVLDEYCGARRQLLARQFISALTGSGQCGASACRPIELHAHEPRRYVADMLAWLHQTAPAERALLLQLTGNPGGSETHLQQLWTDVCRPLEVRLQQVVASCSCVLTLRHLCSLLQFYAETALPAALGVSAVSRLQQVLQQVLRQAQDGLLAALQSQLQHLCEQVEPTDDLRAPASFSGCLQLLEDAILEQGVGSSRLLVVETEELVAESTLAAVSRACSTLSVRDSCVFQLNCLQPLSALLARVHEVAPGDDRWLQLVSQRVHAQLQRLTSEQWSHSVQSLALESVCGQLDRWQAGELSPPLSQQPGLQTPDMRRLVQSLDVLLSNPETLLLPQLRKLSSARHRQTVSQRATGELTHQYERLHQVVTDAINQYPPHLLPHSPQQLRQLLGC